MTPDFLNAFPVELGKVMHSGTKMWFFEKGTLVTLIQNEVTFTLMEL